MGADIRQDAISEAVSTPLAVLPRFVRPGPSRQVESALRRLLLAMPVKEYEDHALVLKFCPKTKARTTAEFPAWLKELFGQYRVPL